MSIFAPTNVKVIADANKGLYQQAADTAEIVINSNVPVTVESDMTLNGDVTVNGDLTTNGDLIANGVVTATTDIVQLRDIQEITTPIVGATGGTTHNAALARIFVHSGIAGAFTANFTNVGLVSGWATTLTLVLVQGATPRVPTMGTIDGNAVTFSWQGNVRPLGTANRTDVVTFSVINSGGTYLVYGQLVSF
jgi:hypothetical protein